MSKFFDYKKLEKEIEEKPSEIFTTSYGAMSFETLTNIEKDLKRFPTDGEISLMQTDKAFNSFGIIEYLAQKHPIKELYATTYSLSRKTVDKLVYLHDKGMVESINLMVSDSMLKRNPTTIEYAKGLFSSRANIKIVYAWVHAKVYLMKTHDDYFILEGSGNLSENAQYEQYIFFNKKEAFEFRKQLFDNANLKTY